MSNDEHEGHAPELPAMRTPGENYPAGGDSPEVLAGDETGVARNRSPAAIPAEVHANARGEVQAPPGEPGPIRREIRRVGAGGTAPPTPTADETSDHDAAHLADAGASAFMSFSLAGVFRQADALAYKKFRDRLLADCGNPTDPVEIMMVEQLALAHLNVGRLHFKSATAEDLESARTYGALAIGLAGEFRRTALALRSYRVKPQAVITVQPTEVPGVAAAPDSSPGQEGGGDELGSNEEVPDDGGATIPLPESAAGRGRPAEPGQAARARRRGA